MVRNNFAVFILAHGRPEKLTTVNTLVRSGYTGKYYIILDNEDKTIDGYKDLFGSEHIVVFDKSAAAAKFDIMDNFDGRNVVVFARNMCFDIARDLKLDYFAEFEDDYLEFCFRFEDGSSLRNLNMVYTKNIDDVFEATLDFLDDTGVRTVAYAQTGEMIGGKNGGVWKNRLKRKAMNTFFFKVGKPEDDFNFIGRFNDDVNTYVSRGKLGEIWCQIANVNLTQVLTQQQTGGNSEAYKSYGTYVKSFYSVMINPSSVKVGFIGPASARIHHQIDWPKTVPCIISDRFKKERIENDN